MIYGAKAKWEEQRNYRWRHFGYLGGVRMAELLMLNVMRSPTCNYWAKRRARVIFDGLQRLKKELTENRKEYPR